ncbi:FHA domain-containing protein [Tundrisphaera sp. TA3]|uniref:FHA domain-containing protein n=1 Tax=Tundrisphaera sp. TA3 TaxID=3435775 RepID=UPI003EB9D469
MSSSPRLLGVLKPIGGGDPVPLHRETLLIGRRPSCDVCLDFENVSGKHCELHYINGQWYVRDLGSRNGTTVNRVKVTGEVGVMPDVELGIATHHFTLDYEPAGPSGALAAAQMMDDDMVETRKRRSLLEMAGMESEDGTRRPARPARPAPREERPSAVETDFDDPLADHLPSKAPLPLADATDDDFFKMIQGDLG